MTEVLPFVNTAFCEGIVPGYLGDMFGEVVETATCNKLAVMCLL